MDKPMLAVENLNVFYGGSHVLRDTTFVLDKKVLALVGRNGMGKTTLISAIMGLVPARSGSINFCDDSLRGLEPFQIASKGIGYVPQGRRIFSSLTVDEHLKLAYRKGGAAIWEIERIYELFPQLKERRNQMGTLLSGGEQQMLAIGRALVTNPNLLIMDEPSEGLAPVIIEQLEEVCRNLLAAGISIFLAEQNTEMAAAVSDEVMVMVTGRIVHRGPFKELLNDRQLTRRYLGVGFAEGS